MIATTLIVAFVTVISPPYNTAQDIVDFFGGTNAGYIVADIIEPGFLMQLCHGEFDGNKGPDADLCLMRFSPAPPPPTPPDIFTRPLRFGGGGEHFYEH